MPSGWYELTCPEAAGHPVPLRAPVDTEVCVVGGGLAGLATALSLAERGVDVTLLEAQRLGSGASGRNGGMVTGGFAKSTSALQKRLGLRHARALHEASMEGLRLARRRLEGQPAEAGIVGGILIASLFDDPRGLRSELAALNRHYGMRLELRDRQWMRAAYRTERYTEGIFDPDGFHLDPLALVRSYGRSALGRGARIHEQSPATALERQGAGWLVRTEEAWVTARHVVLATSVYGHQISATLRRALVPVVTFVIVTEPLGARLRAAIAPPYGVYDDRFATGYYRPLSGSRLLWGGRIATSAGASDVARMMRRDLAFIYPQLADAGIGSAWSGSMAFSRHKMPLIGKLGDGLWMASGFGGHGLNTTTMAGELLAEAIAEGGRRYELFDPFGPAPTFGPVGRVAAEVIYRGYQLRDRWRMSHRRGAAG